MIFVLYADLTSEHAFDLNTEDAGCTENGLVFVTSVAIPEQASEPQAPVFPEPRLRRY